MANSKLNDGENILVKVDVNNLVFVDPNSVQNGDKVEPRGFKQENLVMFVNLEADLVPRSILTSSGDNKTGTLSSIAKGTLSFTQKKGKNGKDFDSSWTEEFSQVKQGKDSDGNEYNYQNDSSAQSFGIESININIKGANFIPQVNINFVDVRGKTLFESPQNSPYGAFFHLPWPIFYLTVKGYYGKAIRYRLHLTKFSSKFNESNGNFEIATTFVGSTYAFLNDIPLNGILNAPYMYMVESDSLPAKFNEKKGISEKQIKKSSKGYVMLTSVYDEYKQKGLIDKNFPVKTLRELIVVARSLDKILEKEIFGGLVDMKLFVGIKDFEKKLTEFESSIRNWGKMNLSPETIELDGAIYNKLSTGTNRASDEKIVGAKNKGTLELLITDYPAQLKTTKIFAEKFLKQASNNFQKETFNFINKIKNIDQYYKLTASSGYVVSIQGVLKDIFDMQQLFVQQRNKLQDLVEKRMNEVIKDKDKGIGFSPTIRNIFAVILANAEVYIRMMKEVHYKAFEVSTIRRPLLSTFSDESIKNDAIYPWPEVKKQTADKQKVVAYPGDPDLQQKLKSYDKFLWPEIEFLENYQAVGTKRHDSLTGKEGSASKIEFVFENNTPDVDINKISTILQTTIGTPYINKSISSIFYELWERGRFATLVDNFNSTTIQELADREFDNIQKLFEEDSDLVALLKTVTDVAKLKEYLLSFSPFERYPYYQDKIPTTPYLKVLEATPFSIESSFSSNKNYDNSSKFEKLKENLKNYQIDKDSYRYSIYPFNSDLYLNYLDKDSFDSEDLNLKQLFDVDTREGLVAGPNEPKNWLKDPKSDNIFSEKIKIGTDSSANILNTPYFHKQLESDTSNQLNGKYAGSAYLLLNSLPFLDLEDEFNYTNGKTRLSTVFREIGASHFVPYHLILKWGSLYHRYKKKLLEGKDILDGFLTTGNTTTAISGKTFFDGGSGYTLNVPSSITYGATNSIIGLHPLYDAQYHQVINGYSHYAISSGATGFNANVTNGTIKIKEEPVGDGGKYFTSYVDNSKIGDGTNKYYTLLPSVGGSQSGFIGGISDSEQKNFKILWCYDKEVIKESYTDKKFFAYNEYNKVYDGGTGFFDMIDFAGSFFTGIDKSEDGKYSLLYDNHRKIFDLIATFSPQILDKFEEYFLDFASERIEEEIPYKKFPDLDITGYVNGVKKIITHHSVKYDKFQDLLKALVTIDIDTNNDNGDINAVIETLKKKQLEKLTTITKDITKKDNLIKLTIGNPTEIVANTWYGFAKVDDVNTFDYGTYNSSQYTTDNQNLIKLYVGEEPATNCYKNFFIVNNIEISEDNILLFRPLILIYAGWVDSKGPLYTPTKTDFQDYIKTKVLLDTTNRMGTYMGRLLPLLVGLKVKDTANEVTIVNGYNDTPLKLELYNFFKSFNDKWVAGNSLGQRTLIEEFLFLDKANKDIGDVAYISLEKLLSLEDPKNDSANLYSVIGMLIKDTGFDMRGLPAYVNFYGTNNSTKSRITPSKKIAQNLFGTFLDVDYQESSPKIVIQYTGPTSKHLELADINEKYKFKNDSGNLFTGVGSPLVITAPQVFTNGDYAKSNKVVAFEVSIGDQNQGIFKSVQLDQASIRNTTESFNVIENLGRSASGAGANQIDIGLFDIYRQASYTCDVTCMGNVMMQPTMYFYLKNVPMFRGSYWITEVSHNIRNNNIVTTFKGTRIPYASLPDPKDSFLSSYRVLFDKITRTAVAKTKEEENTTPATATEQPYTTTDGITFLSDLGPSKTAIPGESLIKEQGWNSYGVPYNGADGEKYIQKVSFNNKEYLRARVVTMGSQNYPIKDTQPMNIIVRQDTYRVYGTNVNNVDDKIDLTWKDISGSTKYFYSTKFNLDRGGVNRIIKGTSIFYNPNNIKSPITINPIMDNLADGKIIISDIQGPVNVGPNGVTSGLGLSKQLMKDLKVNDGDVVYFEIV